MVIDHIGIAVRSIEAALRQWETLFGYRQMTEIVTNTRQKVRVVFLSRPDSLPVKLVEATDPTSPVHAFAQRGGGLHHLCFRADSVQGEVTRLGSLGARVLAEPQPGEAFEDEKIAFVLAGGLNVELIDTDKRARRLVP
jgi:methylmalonyl-CoA/ethylmalonyl-CoA epimerase